MKYTVIADAGSTKTDWLAIDGSGMQIAAVKTGGLNVLTVDTDEILRTLAEVKATIALGCQPCAVHFYGAGCATPQLCAGMRDMLCNTWTEAVTVSAESDMLGAARALFGDRAGLVCILGTGSNSCLYDGCAIADNVPSLGYILGDEGSGAALGKRLLSDALKRQLPASLTDKFLKWSGLSVAETLERVYRQSNPNRYLASLAPFIKDNLQHDAIHSIAVAEIDRFFCRNVAMYHHEADLPLGFVGSIAVELEDVVREVAVKRGFRISRIIRTPMDGLAEYHGRQHVCQTEF